MKTIRIYVTNYTTLTGIHDSTCAIIPMNDKGGSSADIICRRASSNTQDKSPQFEHRVEERAVARAWRDAKDKNFPLFGNDNVLDHNILHMIDILYYIADYLLLHSRKPNLDLRYCCFFVWSSNPNLFHSQ
jgi:hypothetical protein